MRTRLNYILLNFIILILINGCKKDPIGMDIEALGNYPDTVHAFLKNRDTLHTTLNETAYFTATFKNTVIWQLTITGLNSGAKKVFKGTGTVLDQSNTLWNGGADNPPLKFSNEPVKAVLSFPSFPNVTFSTNLYIFIDGSYNYTKSFLVSDFSSVHIYQFGQTPPNDGNKWWVSDYKLPNNTNTPYNPSPDGNNYLLFQNSPQPGNPYIDYMRIDANVSQDGVSSDSTFTLYVDPNQVYFNIYAYNTVTSGTNDAWVTIQFNESDGSQRTFDIKQPNWTGWKLLSVKYSDLVPAAGTSGSGNPSKLVSIGWVFLSAQTDLTTPETVSIALDHPIFTFGGPYQP